jgi:CRISPR/Cas system-associated exonuclease Cas4 (RecB family)
MYVECPRKYRWYKDKKVPSVKGSKYFALYGIAIQRFFEFYVNKYVKKGIKLTDEQIKLFVRQDWEKILDKEYVVWDDLWCKQNSEEIFLSVYEDILSNLKVFDFFDKARAEVCYNILLKKSQDEINGRIDFIVKNEDGTVEILDGKGSTKLEKNVDTEQLYFYSLMYLLRNKKLPDKIGFWYYKFQKIIYVPIDLKTIIEFKNKFALVKKAIKEDTTWEPRVKITKGCNFCDYKADCDAFLRKKEENRIKLGRGMPVPAIGEKFIFGF